MTTDKISLMDAYLIETLRSNGMSNEEIVSEVAAGNVESLQKFHDRFDFNELFTLANKDLEKFKRILDRGYQIKFVTFNGLKNLLQIRFGKEQERDYVLQEKGIKKLVLDQEQLKSVKQMLSKNWILEEMEKSEAGVIVSIELI